ncbi:MAG TPA: hypothetical protein VNX68_13140, partial [Nitrosopumilaceae archaeon]|nr:hypothetical protein [Nitrosopumilaceae archaeon]
MLNLVEYTSKYYQAWNNFVNSSNNGTLFHRLDFLSYHGKKFESIENHLLFFKGDELFAVLPAGVIDMGG